MSNRRNLQQQRKKGKSSNAEVLLRDELHNHELPCCRLLQQAVQEVFPTTGPIDIGGAAATHNPRRFRQEVMANGATSNNTNTNNATSTTMVDHTTSFGRLMREHLFQQRRRERQLQDPAAANNNTNNAKKKRKKKKKKAANIKQAAASTTDSNDGEEDDSALATASQDSQEEPAAPASTTLNGGSADSSVAAAKEETTPPSAGKTPNGNSKDHYAKPLSAKEQAVTTSIQKNNPVNAYLDRMMECLPVEEQQTAAASPPRQDMEAFVAYLTRDATYAGGRIAIPFAKLEATLGMINCAFCRGAVETFLKADPAPLVLHPMVFGAHSDPNNGTGTNNHNGRAIPVANQKPHHQQAAAAADRDFDYVALEEGTNPMTTHLEAKADGPGVSYFHPKACPSTNGGKKHDSSSKDMVWQFVTASSLSSPSGGATTNKGEDSRDDDLANTAALAVTVSDLERMVRDVMLPLALAPDDLVGATTALTQDDYRAIMTRVHRMDEESEKEIRKAHDTVSTLQLEFRSIKDVGEHNIHVTSGPQLKGVDVQAGKLLERILFQVLWKLLDLNDYPTTSSSEDDEDFLGFGTDSASNRPKAEPKFITPAVSLLDDRGILAHLWDAAVVAIQGYMQAVQTYECELDEMIANSQGRIPALFTNAGHRAAFRTMVDHKLCVLKTFVTTLWSTSAQKEPAFQTGPTENVIPVGSTDPTAVSFRKKWYTYQEFYYQFWDKHKRTLAEEEVMAPSEKIQPKTAGAKNEIAPSSSSSTVSASTQPEVLIQTLDLLAGDVMRGLFDLSTTVMRGRVGEICQVHLEQCRKTLGLLKRVGEDLFVPLLGASGSDDDSIASNASLSSLWALPDMLQTECQNLWSRIQQRNQTETDATSNNGDDPDQNTTDVWMLNQDISELSVAALRLLRNVRRHAARYCYSNTFSSIAAESSGAIPQQPSIPVMPLELAAWMTKPTQFGSEFAMSFHRNDENGYHYDQLAANSSGQCRSGGGKYRVRSLLIAMLYRFLSDQCLAWNAELAEQELLLAMDEFDGGEASTTTTDGKNADIDSGVNAKSGKAAKKAKKKRDKKAVVDPVPPSPESQASDKKANVDLEPPSPEPQASEPMDPPKPETTSVHSKGGDILELPTASASISATDVEVPNEAAPPSEDTSIRARKDVPPRQDVSNNEITESKQQKKKKKKKGAATLQDQTQDSSSKVLKEKQTNQKRQDKQAAEVGKPGKKVEDAVNSATTQVANQPQISTAILSDDHFSSLGKVDSKIGVVDQSGEFQTAESYLVQRLNVLLQSTTSTAGKAPRGGNRVKQTKSPPVVFIS